MRRKILPIFAFILLILLVNGVIALDIENQERLNFGHVVLVSDLKTEPSNIEPGVPALFNMIIQNTGNFFVDDVRANLNLPAEIGFFNDISQKRISKLISGEKKPVQFNLVALPGTSEGVYQANLTVYYVNHIGDERQDSYKVGIIVKSKPKMYAQIEQSDVYKGNNVGDITIKFVNNNVADIKFLTAELMKSEDYTILSGEKVYVGDLDSDDFESVTYRIKTKKKSGEVLIPLKISYKDTMNNPYSEELSAVLTLYNGNDIGKTKSKTATYVVILLIVAGAGYWFWRRWKNKKKREKY